MILWTLTQLPILAPIKVGAWAKLVEFPKGFSTNSQPFSM